MKFKIYSPMLIGEQSGIFDDDDYLYELKFDGVRAVAYLDAEDKKTYILNKRNVKINHRYPELSVLHNYVKKSCVIDGEIVVLKHGMPDFSAIQKRSLMGNSVKIKIAAQRDPVTFVAFDILEYGTESVMSEPLVKRKETLKNNVTPSARIIVSDYIQGAGSCLYELAKQYSLEGVVAKRKDSIYIPSKRTKDWIKIKNMPDDDFAVCGYIRRDNGIISIVLGQYAGGEMTYMGHVTMGETNDAFLEIKNIPTAETSPFRAPPSGNENAVWLKIRPVCRVVFMQRTPSGGLRQPIFRGLRDDKTEEECVYRQEN